MCKRIGKTESDIQVLRSAWESANGYKGEVLNSNDYDGWLTLGTCSAYINSAAVSSKGYPASGTLLNIRSSAGLAQIIVPVGISNKDLYKRHSSNGVFYDWIKFSASFSPIRGQESSLYWYYNAQTNRIVFYTDDTGSSSARVGGVNLTQS